MDRLNSPQSGGGAGTAARPRILLVEDDPGVRRSLQLLLQARGFDVRAFASGEALLADPLAHQAVCLIADYRMADVNGLEILAALRARDWHGRALLITAYPTPQLMREALSHGFDSVIEKPLRPKALADAVVSLVAAAG